MNEFSVKNVKGCIKEEFEDKILLIMMLVYLLGMIFHLLCYATGNGTIRAVLEFIVSVGFALITVLFIAVRSSYYYGAINFPEYFNIEFEAFYLFGDKQLNKDDFLKKIELATKKREEFWRDKSYEAWYNISGANIKEYSKKRHLERTLSKYPKYLQIEFDAYQYLFKYGNDAIFRGMLDESKTLRQAEIKSAIEKG